MVRCSPPVDYASGPAPAGCRTPTIGALGPAQEKPLVEPARPDECIAVATLLYESATGLYDRLVGGRERAVRVIEAALDRSGNNVSLEIVTVARVEGELAGVLVTFPVAEAGRRARRFTRVALRRSPPWTWPRMRSAIRRESRAVPRAPSDGLYVDALATDPRFRRRGVAVALLEAAEEQARERRLADIALITELHNDAARALYRHAGFAERTQRPPSGALPGFVALSKRVLQPGG